MRTEREARVIIAGSGGQGILFLGRLLASAGMLEGKRVTWFPSYGAEMRGGTANCTVIVSNDMIGSPVVQAPDVLVVMNTASLERFQPQLTRRGLLVYDSSLITDPTLRRDVRAVAVPATDLASAVGSVKAANMVMLGALVSATGVVRPASVENALSTPEQAPRKAALELNISAFEKGMHFDEDTQGTDRRR